MANIKKYYRLVSCIVVLVKLHNIFINDGIKQRTCNHDFKWRNNELKDSELTDENLRIFVDNIPISSSAR